MLFYFGTFNPIHNGHLQIAKNLQELTGEKVLFVPAYDRPGKPQSKLTFNHRVEMIRLTGFACCTIEKDLPTPSYTFQTVQKLLSMQENKEKLKFIIGLDQYFKLPSWKNSSVLKNNCKFLVIHRYANFNFDIQDALIRMQQEGWDTEIQPFRAMDISSTQVREGDLSVVPCVVKEYIIKHDLFNLRRLTI